MPRIPNAMRQRVIQRAGERCEYCRTLQAIVVEMEIDHIIPLSANGATTLDNLCLACVSCNAAKLDFQSAIDPATGLDVALFNPRLQQWAEHFTWSEDGIYLLGLTPAGRATVERLRVNRERIIHARIIWVKAGWHPPTD
jgi:hypothetical protein